MSSNKEFTVIIVGTGGVGKTAFSIQLTESRFETDYNPTIEDMYQKLFNVNGEKILINLLDTAGQEEYSVMRDQHWRDGNGFIVMYDITSKQSFEEAHKFIDLIKKAKESEDFPIALLGNKCDLVDSREVTEKAGKDLSKEQQTLFFETSAKVRKNVEESVAALVKTVIQYNTAEEEEEVKPQLTKKTSFLKGLFGRKK